MNIAVFDLETNGMAGASVVSASSIVFDTDGVVLGVFNRFYLPAERPDVYATRVHGLTLGRLAALRRHIPGTPYFAEDWPELLDFWEGLDVEGVVVHNLRFDAAFLPEIAQSAFRWWCSMKGLTNYCAIPKRSLHGKGLFKWPKLGEAADIICNGPAALMPPSATARTEDAVGEGCPHVSLFDCFELYRLVSRIFLHRQDLIQFKPFTIPYIPPQLRPQRQIKPAEDTFIAEVLAYDGKIRTCCC